MEFKDQANELSYWIGCWVTNAQSLETVIRAILHDRLSSQETKLPYGSNFNDLKKGDIVSINPITDWLSLGKLIDEYNNKIAKVDGSQLIEKEVVDIRDALAHGRLTQTDAGENHSWTLIKFNKPDKQGVVRVEFKQIITVEWLKEQVLYLGSVVKMISASIVVS
jgi:hypothetical protein